MGYKNSNKLNYRNLTLSAICYAQVYLLKYFAIAHVTVTISVAPTVVYLSHFSLTMGITE